jgi:hypothetical protein
MDHREDFVSTFATNPVIDCSAFFGHADAFPNCLSGRNEEKYQVESEKNIFDYSL